MLLTETGEFEYQKRYQELQDMIASYFEFLGETDTEHLIRIINLTNEFMKTRGKGNQEE